MNVEHKQQHGGTEAQSMVNDVVLQPKVKFSLKQQEVKSMTNYGITVLQMKVANVLAFIVTLFFNYISSSGLISPYGIGTISRKHPTSITPAGGAFAIWGYIYCLQLCFIIYQFLWPKETESVILHDVGFWYISTCFCNSLWIIIFVQGTTVAMFLSTVTIFCLLFSICMIYVRTGCWRRTRTNILENIVLDIHFSMYGGWVTVASIVNTSISISTVWDAAPEIANICGVLMLIVALLLNIFIVLYRKDPVWGFVLCWATYYISVKQKANASIHTSALVISILIGCISAAVGTFIVIKLLRGRKSTQDEESEDASNKSCHLLVEETVVAEKF